MAVAGGSVGQRSCLRFFFSLRTSFRPSFLRLEGGTSCWEMGEREREREGICNICRSVLFLDYLLRWLHCNKINLEARNSIDPNDFGVLHASRISHPKYFVYFQSFMAVYNQ